MYMFAAWYVKFKHEHCLFIYQQRMYYTNGHLFNSQQQGARRSLSVGYFYHSRYFVITYLVFVNSTYKDFVYKYNIYSISNKMSSFL